MDSSAQRRAHQTVISSGMLGHDGAYPLSERWGEQMQVAIKAAQNVERFIALALHPRIMLLKRFAHGRLTKNRFSPPGIIATISSNEGAGFLPRNSSRRRFPQAVPNS